MAFGQHIKRALEERANRRPEKHRIVMLECLTCHRSLTNESARVKVHNHNALIFCEVCFAKIKDLF